MYPHLYKLLKFEKNAFDIFLWYHLKLFRKYIDTYHTRQQCIGGLHWMLSSLFVWEKADMTLWTSSETMPVNPSWDGGFIYSRFTSLVPIKHKAQLLPVFDVSWLYQVFLSLHSTFCKCFTQVCFFSFCREPRSEKAFQYPMIYWYILFSS